MDFGQFDMRGRAEQGARLIFTHPETGEKLGADEKAPGAMVRGSASPSVQQNLRELMGETTGENSVKVTEDLHNRLVDQAAAHITEVFNIELDGKPVTDARSVLNLTFPVMGKVVDAKGKPVMEGGVPKFEMKNKPFAIQVIEFAAEAGKFSERCVSRLILAARQYGYLAAVPLSDAGHDKPPVPWERNRYSQITEIEKREPPLVDIREGRYLLSWLMDYETGLGPCRYNSNGKPVPVEWSEILAFAHLNSVTLDPIEAKALRGMSVAYVHGLGLTDPLHLSPMGLAEREANG